MTQGNEINFNLLDSESYGITLNAIPLEDSYLFGGNYAMDTYLAKRFDLFIETIESEMKFIANYEFKEDNTVCCLSESQLGVYLDEKVNDKSTAYSVPGFVDCGLDHSVDEIKNVICSIIDKHPILKGRILDTDDMPILVCDSFPSIEIVESEDYANFIQPFDLNKSMARFFIVDGDDSRFVFYEMHHIISDATSRAILDNEFSKAFEGKLDDHIDLGFVQSSIDSFNSQFELRYETAYEFFKDLFADNDDVQHILKDVEGATGSVTLPIPHVRDRVDSFIEKNGISIGGFLNAVFAYTYSRFTGGNKVYFTFTEHGRHEAYNQNALGMFVRTIPIIVDCKNNFITDYVCDVSDLILEAMSNSTYPFRLLAREFDLINNVSFEYNYDLNDTQEISDEITFSDDADRISDFLCVVNDLNDGFAVSVSHLDMFSQDTAERFVNVFKEVLFGFLDKNELKDIDYVSDDDVHIFNDLNITEHTLGYDDILDAFNDNLAKGQDKKLVTMNDKSYTYGEGAYIADKIAKRLKDEGIAPSDCVGFFTERSEHYMFSTLGILSLGAIYVPLDDNYPNERIEFMIKDTDAKAILVSDETYIRAKEIIDNIRENNSGDNSNASSDDGRNASSNDIYGSIREDIVLINVSDIANEGIGSLNNLSVNYNDLACILYTSGTTGVPKGVKITRKAILNLIEAYIDQSGLSNDDVYTLYSSIGFDAASQAICQTFYSGACLSIVPEDIKLNMGDLNEYFCKQSVTHTMMTTQIGKLFIENVHDSTLNALTVGGEKLGEITNPKDYELFDSFGPTETFAFITSTNNADKLDPSSVGALNYNSKVYILDKEHRRVPFGAVGELCIAGYQLSAGYLNREEETEKAFIKNPFNSDCNYDILYRTGDMARLLPDGTIGIVGRNDSQVKIRGNRVELTEVESVIRNIEFIEDVTVQTANNNGNNELVAYVVVSNDLDNNDSDDNYSYNNYLNDNDLIDHVREYVSERKPDYIVPSFVIRLESIPLTVNGKVDKRALPQVDTDSLHADYIAPRTENEKAIVKAFEKVFRNDKIGIYDDFIRLGGDSLTAIRLLSHLEDYNIAAADVLSLRTPIAIAANIKDETLDLNIYTLEEPCPLNEPQLNVYLDIIANDKKDSYIILLTMKIPKKYANEHIIKNLKNMFNAHPILGMCISDEYEIPHLIKGSEPKITVEDNVDEDCITEFLTKPFNLKESLCRFLIHEKEDSNTLYASFHHIIFNALSDSTFKRDLQQLLEGKTPNVDDSFLKVAAFNQEIQKTKEYTKAENFYETMLADCDEAEPLLNSPLADGPGTYSLDLEFNQESLKTFLNENGISENVLFTGVFTYTLTRFVGNNKVLFNIIDNGRDRFDNYNSIGMFVNTLPLLVDCKNQNIHSFMDNASNLVYNVMRYNYYPFRLLANKYNIDSNILFQFMPDWIEGNNVNGDSSSQFIEKSLFQFISVSNVDFSADVHQKGEDYSIRVSYSEKYSKDFIEHFVHAYKLIAEQIINANELGDIGYTSSKDMELLEEYNNTEHSLVYDDVLDAFNDNLANYPSSILVIGDENSYTLSESAFIANEIAISLKESGVKPQDFVAFVCERSELYLFNVLSILSIGATPVPVDSSLPNERIRFILENSNSKAIITDDTTYDRVCNLIEDIGISKDNNGEFSKENNGEISKKNNTTELADENAGGFVDETDNIDENGIIVLNESHILEEDIGNLSHLPVEYGDLAGILYTSGTTGVPKGVKITRKSVLNLSAHYTDAQNLTCEDVYALYTSIGFDAGYKSIFKVLYTGACLVIVPDSIKYNMAKLNDYFIDNNVGHVFITTQVSKLFMQSIDKTSIKVLSVGGEKLGDLECPEDFIVMDDYGPTEAFAFISSIDVSKRIDSSYIGVLNYNSKAYVLDSEYRPVPFGAVGELYLSGSQIADGYLNRDEETEHAFLKNPFSDNEDYGVMYRTGDLVRFLPDGTLGIVGRRDGQVKIRGNRVELSEVESVIREIDFIEDLTVQTIKNGTNNELVAYVVVNSDIVDIYDAIADVNKDITDEEGIDHNDDSNIAKIVSLDNDIKDEIIEYVANNKPDYMVPSFIIGVEEIPLTVNGKVDKHALPKVDTDSLHADYIAPRTENEKAIVKAFEKVFHKDKIGIYDDFIRLGGDSLTAIHLLSHLEDYNIATADFFLCNDTIRFNSLEDYNIATADVLSLRTPIAIAANIKDKTLDLNIYSLEEPCPLNEPQLNVYLDIIANDKKDSYLIPLIMKIPKKYANEHITKSLKNMFNAHPILCMCISDEYEIPHLIKGSEPKITVEDNVDEDCITEFLTKPFNLKESLCRFLIHEKEDSNTLYASFHHIIFNALSDSTFKRDLQQLLEGKTPNVDDSFLKVAAFNQEIQKTKEYTKAENFYETMLADCDEAEPLLNSPLADGPDTYSLDLNFNHESYKTFLNENGISENVLFTGVFAYTLSRFVGNNKALFNIIDNGRDRFDNYNAIGMFVNTLPLLVDCKNQNIRSFMDNTSNLVYNVMRYNYYPFRLLANKYNIDSNILFQFMPDWIKDDESINIYSNPIQDMNDLIADLSVGVIQKGDKYNLSITYSDKYSQEFIKSLASSYELILNGMLNTNSLSDINYTLSSDLDIMDAFNQNEKELKYADILMLLMIIL